MTGSRQTANTASADAFFVILPPKQESKDIKELCKRSNGIIRLKIRGFRDLQTAVALKNAHGGESQCFCRKDIVVETVAYHGGFAGFAACLAEGKLE